MSNQSSQAIDRAPYVIQLEQLSDALCRAKRAGKTGAKEVKALVEHYNKQHYGT